MFSCTEQKCKVHALGQDRCQMTRLRERCACTEGDKTDTRRQVLTSSDVYVFFQDASVSDWVMYNVRTIAVSVGPKSKHSCITCNPRTTCHTRTTTHTPSRVSRRFHETLPFNTVGGIPSGAFDAVCGHRMIIFVCLSSKNQHTLLTSFEIATEKQNSASGEFTHLKTKGGWTPDNVNNASAHTDLFLLRRDGGFFECVTIIRLSGVQRRYKPVHTRSQCRLA